MFATTVLRFIRAAAAGAGMVVAALAPAAGQTPEVVPVTLDHATLMRLDGQAATIVIGNPAIADAVVQQNGALLVLTGKSYGRTNLIILDAAGREVASKVVEVGLPQDLVTIQRGGQRYSYACRTRCENVLMLGDAAEPFNKIREQVGARQGLAQGASGN